MATIEEETLDEVQDVAKEAFRGLLADGSIEAMVLGKVIKALAPETNAMLMPIDIAEAVDAYLGGVAAIVGYSKDHPEGI